MLTDKEYRLMKRIQKAGGGLKVHQLRPWEKKTFAALLQKGYIELEPESEEEKEKLKDGKVVFDEYTGKKADAAKERAEPELNPRPARIFTPAFVLSLFGRMFLGFFFGLLFCFLVKRFLVFL